MNRTLFNILELNMGRPITSALAMDICHAAAMMDELVSLKDISRIMPIEHDGVIFSVERIEEIEEEMKPLHRSHWDETEEHRHGLPFNPDYLTFVRYERAGRYILFTIREDGKLVGDCAMYISSSAHTKTLIAKEDTLYLLPKARRGKVAVKFIEYCELALKQLGVREVNVTVKTVNRAGLFFQRLGYRHVENGLTKILEDAKCVKSENAA